MLFYCDTNLQLNTLAAVLMLPSVCCTARKASVDTQAPLTHCDLFHCPENTAGNFFFSEQSDL